MHMDIYLVLTLIHHSGSRSNHTTVIYFLLPRLINNSWVTIAGGASQRKKGTPGDPLQKQDPLKNRRANHSLQPLCTFTTIITDTTAFIQRGDNLFFPAFPHVCLWAVLTPSFRALIKIHAPNGSWQAALRMGCSPSLHLPHASGNTNSSSPSTDACLPAHPPLDC